MTAHSADTAALCHGVSTQLIELLRWWTSELKSVAASAYNKVRLRGARQLRLQVSGEVVSVHTEADPAVPLLHLSLQQQRESARSAIGAAGLPLRANVRIDLPESEILLCSLRFPALRGSDLAAAIDLQLERELPLPREQVYVDWHIDAARLAAATAVTVAVVRCATVDAWVQAVRSWGWQVSRLGTHATGEWQLLPERAAKIDLSIGPRDRRLIALGVLLGIASLMTVAAQWVYERWSLGEEITLAHQSSVQLAAQRNLLATEAEPIRALQRIMAVADGVAVLQSITQAVPLDTWLYRTQISLPMTGEATLLLSGYGPSSTALIDTLERHPDFAQVELVAAEAADTNGLQRIELQGQWRGARVQSGGKQ